MSFTYPLTMPSSIPSGYQFKMKEIQGVITNPFTGSQTVYDWTGRHMEYTLEFPPLTKEQAIEYNIFFLKLRGLQGSFYFTPPDYQRMGSGGGTPQVSVQGEPQDTVLSVKLFSTSSLVLKAGDMFSLPNGELKFVMEDVNTDGSGNANIKIDPPLRSVVTVDTPLEVDAPKGIFRLLGKDVSYNVNVASLYGVTFGIREAF